MRKGDLIEQLRQRDQQGMIELMRHYGPLMRYIVSPILEDFREQEECLSDVAMKVWEKIDTFDTERGSWTTWLSALTRNTALNRARRLPQARQIQEIPPDLPSPDADPYEELIRQERLNALKAALQHLSAHDRTLFYRKYYYRQSTAQIAAESGLTTRAVEGRLYRLKKVLKLELGGDR